MIIYFAGADGENQYAKMLREAGAKHRLESYFYLKEGPTRKGFDSYLLDSGGFSARNKGVPISVVGYSRYLNDHQVELAFNLDTNDFEETKRNQRFLERECPGTYIIPIYHYGDLKEDNYLEELIGEYPYIGLGGVAGRKRSKEEKIGFWAHIFKQSGTTTRIHGLGLTKEDAMKTFPFYSVDSTSWQSFGRYGQSKSTTKRIARVRVRTRHYLDNIKLDMLNYWVKLETEITELWTERGIVWDQFKP